VLVIAGVAIWLKSQFADFDFGTTERGLIEQYAKRRPAGALERPRGL
jgi:hypothetical protein